MSDLEKFWNQLLNSHWSQTGEKKIIHNANFDFLLPSLHITLMPISQKS